jgi:hypothetical protein
MDRRLSRRRIPMPPQNNARAVVGLDPPRRCANNDGSVSTVPPRRDGCTVERSACNGILVAATYPKVDILRRRRRQDGHFRAMWNIKMSHCVTMSAR